MNASANGAGSSLGYVRYHESPACRRSFPLLAPRSFFVMSTVIDSLERQQLRRVPNFAAGDRVRVHFQVIEGQRRQGLVQLRQHRAISFGAFEGAPHGDRPVRLHEPHRDQPSAEEVAQRAQRLGEQRLPVAHDHETRRDVRQFAQERGAPARHAGPALRVGLASEESGETRDEPRQLFEIVRDPPQALDQEHPLPRRIPDRHHDEVRRRFRARFRPRALEPRGEEERLAGAERPLHEPIRLRDLRKVLAGTGPGGNQGEPSSLSFLEEEPYFGPEDLR